MRSGIVEDVKRGLIISSVLVGALVLPALAQAPGALKFDFSDPKKINSVQWFIDSPLEPIAGSASGVSGTLVFDPANPAKSSGTLVIDAKTIAAPVALMSEHIQGGQWLDTTKYPTIEFKLKKVKAGKANKAGRLVAVVTGDLTVRGITKEVTTPVTVQHIKGGLADRTRGGMQGDTFKLRTDFTISRKDFAIGPQDERTSKVVGDSIELRVALTGGQAK